MEAIMTQVTTSISEFKKNPNESVAQAGNRPFAVLTNNKPSFYVVPPELYEKIADIIFDLEIIHLILIQLLQLHTKNMPARLLRINHFITIMGYIGHNCDLMNFLFR